MSVWAGGTIDIGTRDATTDRARISATTRGLSVGADVQIARNLSLGIGGGLGRDSSSIAQGDGHVSANSKVLAFYGSAMPYRDLFVDGMVAHGWLNFDTRRVVADTGDTARGRRDGHFTTASLAGGIDRQNGALRWSVYGRAEYLDGTLDAYGEAGADLYDLRYDARGVRSTLGVFGFRTSYRQKLRFGAITAGLRGEWQHEFSGGSRQRLDYADVSGPAYYSIGEQGWTREQFVLSPSLDLMLPSGWDLGLDLGFRGSSGERSAQTRVQIRKAF